MTNDREIIENYLNKYYTPAIKTNRDNMFDNLKSIRRDLIGVNFREDKKHVSEQILVRELVSIFGNYTTDEGNNIAHIVKCWFNNKLDSSFQEVLDSLKDVKIIFGRRSWEVKKDGLDFDIEWLIEKHKGLYNKPTVTAVYEQWKHKEIVRVSDEMLKS